MDLSSIEKYVPPHRVGHQAIRKKWSATPLSDSGTSFQGITAAERTSTPPSKQTSITTPALSPRVSDTFRFPHDVTSTKGPVNTSAAMSWATGTSNPRDILMVFKKQLPENIRKVDIDYYLILFQDELLIRTQERRIHAGRAMLPPTIHDVAPSIAFITAFSTIVDQIKNPRQRIGHGK